MMMHSEQGKVLYNINTLQKVPKTKTFSTFYTTQCNLTGASLKDDSPELSFLLVDMPLPALKFSPPLRIK